MKFIIFILTVCFCTFLNAQSIVGEWETYDDESEKKTSVVEIYKEKNKYFGKIVNLYEDSLDSICEECKGINKDKPVIGLIIIENLKKDEDEFNNGTILDPKNGKTYKCQIELIENNKLKLRGYIGISLFGRTQYWLRKT
ncbi:MAG: DUF2147 domain-containing protein [Flavobacteriaceae bacterium]|nr:DUF2147 domain-containing protein [Flavobacteriaceae bacterium]